MAIPLFWQMGGADGMLDPCDRCVLFWNRDQRPVEEVAWASGMPVLRYEKRPSEGDPLRSRVLRSDAWANRELGKGLVEKIKKDLGLKGE